MFEFADVNLNVWNSIKPGQNCDVNINSFVNYEIQLIKTFLKQEPRKSLFLFCSLKNENIAVIRCEPSENMCIHSTQCHIARTINFQLNYDSDSALVSPQTESLMRVVPGYLCPDLKPIHLGWTTGHH